MEHSFTTGKTKDPRSSFHGERHFRVDAARQLILSEQGLHLRDRATGALSLHTAVEADNRITRSNDARAHPCGAIWFGTMGIDEEAGAGAIYHFFKGSVRVLFPNITIPNSICFSPDGAAAYFVDTPTHQLTRVAIDPKTALPDWRAAAVLRHKGAGWIDGSVCDADGNVWNARWGAGEVACLSPDGREISKFSVPLSPQTSCPAFVGKDADRMIVTSAYKLMSERSARRRAGRGEDLHRQHPRQRASRAQSSALDARVTDLRMAGLDHADGPRRRLGQINNPAPYERAAVIDAHDDALAVGLVDDLDARAERQALVRGGHRRRVHPLAIGGHGMKRIPGRAPAFGGVCAGQ